MDDPRDQPDEPHAAPPEAGHPQHFSDSDRAALVELARARQHRKWLGDLLKRWAQWIAAVVIAGKLGLDVWVEAWRRLHGD